MATPYVAHAELQAGDATGLPLRTLRYNVLLTEKNALPVESIVILLRPVTRHAEVTGRLVIPGASGEPVIDFRYHVLRVWTVPLERFLSGGVGLLPFALIARGGEAEATAAMEVLKARIAGELPPDEQQQFLAATFVLAGLKHSRVFLERLFQGVTQMRESVTYQAILEEGVEKGRIEGKAEGKAEGARDLLLKLAERRLGPPNPEALRAVQAVSDVARLEALVVRLLEVETWDDLLAGEPAGGM